MKHSRLLIAAALSFVEFTAQGQFAPGSALSASSGPPLRAVDVDGDTDLDLFGLYDFKHFRWHANTDGNGDFSIALDVVSATEPVGRWITGDVNGDALDDIIFLDGVETTVWWFENLGNAVFQAPMVIGTLPIAPVRMTLADISGEGFPDLVFVIDQDPGADVAWMPNTGSGFGTLEWIEHDLAGAFASLLVAGDIDLTGGIDLLVSDPNQTVFALRNTNGDATAWEVDTLIAFPSYPYENASTIIDVDNDGDLDLAEAGPVALHWAENHIGEGGAWSAFTDHVMEPWTTAGHGAFGQLGCNAASALVFVPSFPTLPVTWSAWTDGLGDFAYRTELMGVPRGTDLLLADLTGDGKDDLVINHPEGAAWYRNIIVPATTDLQLPALDTLCMFGPAYALLDATPAGGRWSGFAVDDSLFYRSNVNGTGTYTLDHAVYEAQGCPVGDSTSIYVTELPVISPALSSPLCSDGEPIQLSSLPAATAWEGVGPDGVLDPATFDEDVVVAIYTDATGETCAAETEPIEVWDALPATISPVGPLCITDGPQLIVASAQPPTGVEWSGDIVSWNTSGATFDPAMGAGTYTVVLDAFPTQPQQCPGSDTLVIAVSDFIPNVQTEALLPQCAEGDPIALDALGSPAGGVWSGPGVNGNMLEPQQLTAGHHFLTYTYFDPGGCAASEALEVDLVDTVIVSWTVDDLIFCENDEPVAFTAEPAGGIWSAPLDANGVLDPTTLSVGQFPLAYHWAGGNGCILENTAGLIERWATSIVEIDGVGVLCDDDPTIVITGTPSGTWSGAGTGEGSFTTIEPSVLGAGIWPVTLTAANPGECPGSTTLDILIEVCTGSADQSTAGLAVQPNPFAEQLVVNLGQQSASRIDVLDASGRVLASHGPTGTGVLALDLGHLPAGTYVVQVTGTDGSLMKARVVKL